MKSLVSSSGNLISISINQALVSIAPMDKYRNPDLVGALLAAPQGGASAAPTFQCLIAAAITIVESDKTSGSIKSEARAGMATWGEVVGLFIRPATASAETYTVEVVSKKRMQTQITGQNWEPLIIAI